MVSSFICRILDTEDCCIFQLFEVLQNSIGSHTWLEVEIAHHCVIEPKNVFPSTPNIPVSENASLLSELRQCCLGRDRRPHSVPTEQRGRYIVGMWQQNNSFFKWPPVVIVTDTWTIHEFLKSFYWRSCAKGIFHIWRNTHKGSSDTILLARFAPDRMACTAKILGAWKQTTSRKSPSQTLEWSNNTTTAVDARWVQFRTKKKSPSVLPNKAAHLRRNAL